MNDDKSKIQYINRRERKYMDYHNKYANQYVEIPIKERHICNGCRKNCAQKGKNKVFYETIVEFSEYKKYIDAPDEIVVRNHEIIVIFNYPLKKSVKFTLFAKNPQTGISRIELIEFITSTYQKIYDVEELTSNIPVGYIGDTSIRNITDGMYGIWGHKIDFLRIEKIMYFPMESCIRLIIG
jgi:hypothetical protein